MHSYGIGLSDLVLLYDLKPRCVYTISSFAYSYLLCLYCLLTIGDLLGMYIKQVFSILLREDYIACGHRARVDLDEIYRTGWCSGIPLSIYAPLVIPLHGVYPATSISWDKNTNIPSLFGMSCSVFPSFSICTQLVSCQISLM